MCSTIWGQDEANLGTSSQHCQLDPLVALYCKWGGSGTIEVASRCSPQAASVWVVVSVCSAGGNAGVQVGENLLMSSFVAEEMWLRELSEK